ncbi:MAG: hypothetical protein Q7V05_14590 [Methanoregula sp.]|nr:hypothetical protein [Methanoregula sp.]
MTDGVDLPGINSELMAGIPLYLIPRAIADQIKKKREAIVYIEARPEKGHFFTITIKTSEHRVTWNKDAEEKGEENNE